MLVLVDQLQQSEPGSEVQEFSDVVDDVLAFYALLEQIYLIDDFLRHVIVAVGQDYFHAL